MRWQWLSNSPTVWTTCGSIIGVVVMLWVLLTFSEPIGRALREGGGQLFPGLLGPSQTTQAVAVAVPPEPSPLLEPTPTATSFPTSTPTTESAQQAATASAMAAIDATATVASIAVLPTSTSPPPV